MTKPIATLALAAAFIAPASAQTTTPRGGAAPPRTFTPPAAAAKAEAPAASAPKADGLLLRSGQEVPRTAGEIVAPDPNVAVPTVAVDPLLLQPENGPFMIMARTFRGPDAPKFAAALAQELRAEHHLPAFVWFIKIQPMRSNIRNVPPTAPKSTRNGEVAAPRAYEEAAVLVGNCKTTDEANKLLTQVKKIRPKSLKAVPTLGHRVNSGLKYAYMTTNPLVASQHLFPGQGFGHHEGKGVDLHDMIGRMLLHRNNVDPFVQKMNGSGRSLYHCPGPYTLQVYEFTGRTTNDPRDGRFDERSNEGRSFLGKSPLGTAYDDAEHLAAVLAKYPKWLGGAKPYVYHDRSSSKVMVGSFRSADDPALKQVVEALVNRVPFEVSKEKGVPLPLAPVPVLVGSPEGQQIHDEMVRKATGTGQMVPDLIPIPTSGR